MNVKVVSVSKTEETISRTAAAIFVITQEDIRRSGATNIPDLLRMLPDMDVAQIDTNTWAISARGFDARFSNELLVLLDGRSVYTPTTGGVFWDALDVPLEDIDRIEVIRGPGGSVWCTDAVDGAINIITKKTSDTKGALVAAGGGNVDQGFGTIRYGGGAGGRRCSPNGDIKSLPPEMDWRRPDWMMPGAEGPEICLRVRALSERPYTSFS